jgi:hypothetical protein
MLVALSTAQPQQRLIQAIAAGESQQHQRRRCFFHRRPSSPRIHQHRRRSPWFPDETGVNTRELDDQQELYDQRQIHGPPLTIRDPEFWSEKTIPTRLAAGRHRTSKSLIKAASLAKSSQTISSSTVNAPLYQLLRLQSFQGFDRKMVAKRTGKHTKRQNGTGR